MKRILYVVIVVIALCLLALPACGGAGPPGEPVTKADDVLGTWHRTKSYTLLTSTLPQCYMQLRADGTGGFSRAPDKWDLEWMSLEFTFEGTQFSVSETAYRGFGEDYGRDVSCTTGAGAPDAVYEIQQLANGNLKFVNAQDECVWRRQLLADAEWEPLP